MLFIIDMVLCGAFQMPPLHEAVTKMIHIRSDKKNMFCRDHVDCPRFYFCDRSIPFMARCERQTPSIPIPVSISPR